MNPKNSIKALIMIMVSAAAITACSSKKTVTEEPANSTAVTVGTSAATPEPFITPTNVNNVASLGAVSSGRGR